MVLMYRLVNFLYDPIPVKHVGVNWFIELLGIYVVEDDLSFIALLINLRFSTREYKYLDLNWL